MDGLAIRSSVEVFNVSLKLSKKNFDIVLKDYYKVRGWDEKGIPKKETVKNLGLDGSV